MALDFSTKATIYNNQEFKNRVTFAIRESSKNALNYYRAGNWPSNWSQSGRDKVEAFLSNALQNPHSVSDKVALFVISDYSGNSVSLTDTEIGQLYEANFTLLSGLVATDYA